MKRKRYQRKLILVTTLALLLIIMSIFTIGLLQKTSYGQRPSSQEQDKQSEIRIQKAQNEIVHHPDIAQVEITFSKKENKPVLPPLPAGSKYVALTFDDGPGNNSTQRILKVLQQYNVKATWFVLGSKATQNPDMLRQIANAGHEVNNHSYSHANLINLSLEGALGEINSTQSTVESIIGKKPNYLRPPYGSYNESIASACGLGIAMWSVDSLDWKLRNGEAAYNQVISTMTSNPVILFHDIYETSADAVDMLVPKLVSEGYTFITYSQYRQIGG